MWQRYDLEQESTNHIFFKCPTVKKGWYDVLDWMEIILALQDTEKGNLMELVDRRVGTDFNKEEVMVLINVTLLCTKVSATLRPMMVAVVSILEDRTEVQKVVSEMSEVFDQKKLEAMRQYYYDHSISMKGP
ncbi:hypothetical protein VNO77_22365 [Canavalia gladiata]|uniref:Uncharacterized protein n=1 Tax=Canavalia gladiata TaxID=3824 RepID=A0AAN9QAQ4_CANGL